MKSARRGKANSRAYVSDMIRRLAFVGGAVLVFAAFIYGAHFLWSKFQSRQYEQAVAEAEAWNRSHWENGSALRITARMDYSRYGEPMEREAVQTCFQKRMVDRNSGFWTQTDTVTVAYGFQRLFGFATETRGIQLGPSRTLCIEVFRDGPPTELPAHFSGDVVINEQPAAEDISVLYVLEQRMGPSCRLRWTTERPLDLEEGIRVNSVQILSVEEVAMSSAVAKPDHMGSADATIERLVQHFLGRGDPNKPARFEWNEAKKCWRGTGSGKCEPKADDLCGVPRL